MKFKKSRFVDKEEVERVGKLPPGNAHPVRKLLSEMTVGQIFKVDREDWTQTGRTPQGIVNQVSKAESKKFDFSVAADDSGWFIERLE